MSKLIRGVFLGVLEVASAGRLQYVVVVVAATAVIHVGEGRRVVLCHHAGQARLAHATVDAENGGVKAQIINEYEYGLVR